MKRDINCNNGLALVAHAVRGLFKVTFLHTSIKLLVTLTNYVD